MIKSALARVYPHLPASVADRLITWRDRHPLVRRTLQAVAGWLKAETVTIQQGAGAGLKFNPTQGNLSYAMGTNEPLIQEALQRHLRPGDTFYDVGANIGFFTLIGASLVGPRGRVVAFEPVPETAALAAANAEINGFKHVDVRAEAAAEAAGTAEIQLGSESQIARLTMAGTLSKATRRLTVQLAAIDELIGAGTLPPPDFVKMDIEGAEVSALRGMANTLRQYHPTILCELHSTHAEVATLLRKYGYTLSVLESEGSVEEAPEHAHVLAIPPTET